MGDSIPSRFSLGVALFVAVGSIACSYGMSVISAAIGQPTFYEAFSLARPGEAGYPRTSQILSAMTGVNAAGSAAGALAAGWACDALGRKIAIQAGAAILVLGSVLCAGSVTLSMFLTARFLAGLGVGSLVTGIPMYQAEVSTPESRGLIVSLHGIMFGVGYSIAGWIGVGTYFYTPIDPTSTFPWRFPFALQALPALILLIGSPFLPSSPRWLLEKDRAEEARTVLEKLHLTKRVDNSAKVTAHFEQMQAQLELDRAVAGPGSSRLDIVRTPSNRRRVLVGIIVMLGNQLTGVYVISSYGVLIYTSLGFSGAWPLILAALWVSCSIPGNIWAAFMVDHYGRVRLMLIGLVGTACALLCECVLQALYMRTENRAGQKAAVFFIFLSIFFWSFFIDAVQYVYLSEIFPTRIRSQGMAVGMVAYYVALIVILIAGPMALDSISWRFLLVLFAITCTQTLLVYFLCPETKRMSLDDINRAFGEPVAVPYESEPKPGDGRSANSHHIEEAVPAGLDRWSERDDVA